MAARTRGRRRLTVAGRDFLWYVADDPDARGPVLRLFAADKTLAVTYFLERAWNYPGHPFLVVRERGVRVATPESPAWPGRSVATPAFVREVAEWVLSADRRAPEESG
jgi:hypothetical protein